MPTVQELRSIAHAVRLAVPTTKLVPTSASGFSLMRSALLSSAIDGAGAWLATRARLEELSIAGVARLARELEIYGAPIALVQGAREAARNEARHALAMRRLARRAGNGCHAIAPSEERGTRARTILEIAIANVIEGCVHETYGALLATWQAMHAEDTEVKATMETIADDATAHAALAWEVRTWLDGVLDPDKRTHVDASAAEAVQALASELAREPDRYLVRELGIPTAAQACLLLRELFTPRRLAA
jgi:hypothetical protein